MGEELDNTLLERILKSNELVNEESNRLISWSLSILGGTILLLINSKYVSLTGWFFYSYGLFGIGWLFIFMSIYYGQSLTLHYTAGALITKDQSDEDLITYLGEVDKKFHKQIKYFKYALVPFAAWLFLLLTWFMFFKP